ncbi:MAG: response regulator [Rhodospirillales bacterium]
MNDLQQRLIAAFEAEYREHLTVVRGILDDLEQAGWDVQGIDLPELYRHVHSLKGAARAVNIKPVEDMAHKLEGVIDLCQSGELVLVDSTVRDIRRVLDAIEDSAESGVKGTECPITKQGSDALSRLTGVNPSPDISPAQVDDKPTAPELVKVGSDAGAGQSRVESKTDERTSESVRISAQVLDELMRRTGDFHTSASEYQAISAEIAELELRCSDLASSFTAFRKLLGHQVGNRIDGDFADELGQTTLDLEQRIKSFGQLAVTVKKKHQDRSLQIRNMATQLEDHVRQARMVPAESVFGYIQKMARDIAKDSDKEIEVSVRGLDTMADRWVLQTLRDPIMHLVRNAISHGIESPDERVDLGKSREGKVALTIESEGGMLQARIADDGRGLDIGRICEKALERGLIADVESFDPTDNRITDILTSAGFSTADTVTEISGRGVGLSVVKQAITRLEGRFDISPQAPYGTEMSIEVPISVSSKRLLHVVVEDEEYCVPLRSVEQIHRFDVEAIELIDGRPAVFVDDGAEPLWLVPFGMLLDPATGSLSAPDDTVTVVVLQSNHKRIGAVVDSIVGVRVGLIRAVPGAAGNVDIFSGGVVLDDGTVVSALSIGEMLDRWRDDAGSIRIESRTAEHVAPPSVLVVDDSVTTRTLERSLLEANGYRVSVSVDGRDALESLRRQPVDLVVSDVEMPHLDGFGLLRAMKQDPSLAAIPVILVTSRDSPDDKQRGLKLGAEAYVVKQRFDQHTLLATIGQLV